MSDMRQLLRAPRALWAIYAIAFLDSLGYFAFSYALIMHLGQEVGLPDQLAGLFYGIFGVCISLCTLVLGFVADVIGVRMSICVSSAGAFVARLLMAYAVLGQSVWLSVTTLLGLVSPFIALSAPAVPTAMKRYTTERTRTLAFSVYYGVMNVAAFVATPLVDLTRMNADDSQLMWLPPYAFIIAGTALLHLPIFFIALVGVHDLNLQEDGETLAPIEAHAPGASRPPVAQRVRALLLLRDFWRAVVVVACQIGVKSGFRYFDALYLPYVTRAYRDAASFPYLSLLGINPLIVIAATLTGAITLVTGRMHPVTAMIIGAFIGGVAPFFMAVGPYLWPILLYVLFTSLGEVIWSPVSYSFLVSLTTEGDEGAWMALVGMPTFLAKMLTGSLTGALLGRFCPDPRTLCDDARSAVPGCAAVFNGTEAAPPPPLPQVGGTPGQCYSLPIWAIIGLTTVSSSVALFAARRFIRGHADDHPVEFIELDLQEPLDTDDDDFFHDEGGDDVDQFLIADRDDERAGQ